VLRDLSIKEGSCKIILKIITSFISFFYKYEFNNVLHEDNITFGTKFRKESSQDFILSIEDLTL